MMETMTERTVWNLARLADVSDPDSIESPGAKWLRQVETAAEEAIENGSSTDDLHEYADGAVPIYTHERLQVFVDLAAYNEDVTNLSADASDLTGCAGVALYMIAERLIAAIMDEESGEDEER